MNNVACIHHWYLRTPQPGQFTVQGHCARCHERREFLVTMPGGNWEDTPIRWVYRKERP